MMAMKTIVLAACALVWAGAGAASEPETARLEHRSELTVQYPVMGIGTVDDALRKWLEEHIHATMDDYSGVALRPDMPESADGFDVSYTLSRASERAVAVVFRTMVMPYKAAHPSTRTDALNFDLRTGRPLAFADLFADPEKALAVMAAGARAKIRDDVMGKYADQLPEGLDDDDSAWFMDGFEPEADNYSAVIMVPGGVKVVFQQYQVLPYVFGMPEAVFTLDELSPAGPDRTLWDGR